MRTAALLALLGCEPGRFATELRLEPPHDLALQQYDQIAADFSSRIAPEIGGSRVG
jgi:hypothetical protein